nr:ABC transporter ATP-binding protein [uncultured Acetatifactor sp.]
MAEERNSATNKGPGPGHGSGGPRGRGPRPKVENPGKIFKRIMSYTLKDYGLGWVVVVICIFATVYCSLQGTMFMRTLIDDYILPLIGRENPEFDALAGAVTRVAIFYAIGVAASYTQSRVLINIGQGTLRNIRNDLFEKMEALPIKYFDTHAHGDIMSIYTNDVDTLRQMISQSIPQMVNSVITVVSVFVCMLILDIPLTIMTLLMVGLMLVATKKIGAQSSRYFVAQQKALGALNGCVEETMTGQKVVKVFCHEQESMEQFNRLNDQLFESAYQANRFANIMMPVNAQLGNLSYVVCAVVGGILTITGISGLTLGGLASFLNFNKSFNMPINQVSMQFNSIIMALAGADRIFKLMDEKPEVDEGYVELVNAVRKPDGELAESKERTGLWAWKHYHKADNTTTYVELTGDVVFDQVDFGYNDEKMILHDIVLHAEPGQKIAFVGATGAGKTTITNLINRFYDIQDGKIRYDAINVNKIKKADLRRSLGIVLQDTHLFTGTVMENIRYGKMDATDAEVKKAAVLANAHGFIRRLPEGYDTMLYGDGANLSQGQRQLLAIARAAIADPPVLILDEHTNGMYLH